MDLPPAFTARLTLEYGDEDAQTVLSSMRARKQASYWVNPLRDGELPTLGDPVAGLDDVYSTADARDALVRHPAATTGRIYLVNPSSVLAVVALDPQPEETVLDLAAAPGGKTLIAAARMRNTGTITAVDPIKSRYYRMRANLARCGVTNVRCKLDDGRKMGRRMPATFDRVLLDAPCSSEARFRADEPATFAHWSPRKVRETTRKQRGLIRAAFGCLKPGGTLVYCTCSFGRKENEGIVEYLTKREPMARIAPLAWPDLAVAAAGNIDGTVRIRPDATFDGFYIARLTKLLGGDVAHQPPTRLPALEAGHPQGRHVVGEVASGQLVDQGGDCGIVADEGHVIR